MEACRRGHELTEANTYTGGDGSRRCRTCKRLQRRRTADAVGRLRAPTTPISMGADLPRLAAAMREVEFDSHTWARSAACAEMPKNKFFPARGQNQKAREAVAVCAGCSVRLQCLAANITEECGVFGGTTSRVRSLISGDLGRYLRTEAA